MKQRRRGYDGISTNTWLMIGGGAALLGFIAFYKRKEIGMTLSTVVKAGQEAAFALALPSHGRYLAGAILQVARESGVDPFVIAALLEQESQYGRELKPAGSGPAGTGDFAKRDPAKWKYALPPDGGGWGRGLMQVDYGSQAAWLNANNWRDPLTNIRKGVEILQGKMKFFQIDPDRPVVLSPDAAARRGVDPGLYSDPRPLRGDVLIRAALAAYNGGEANVLMSIAAKKPPGLTTINAAGYPGSAAAPGVYDSSILSRISKISAAFTSALA